jgi:hypothetical protein
MNAVQCSLCGNSIDPDEVAVIYDEIAPPMIVGGEEMAAPRDTWRLHDDCAPLDWLGKRHARRGLLRDIYHFTPPA